MRRRGDRLEVGDVEEGSLVAVVLQEVAGFGGLEEEWRGQTKGEECANTREVCWQPRGEGEE